MRTGEYFPQLSGEVSYKAFIPNKLPFKVNFDETMQLLLSEADQALGRLDGIGETIPDADFFIFMYVRKESTLSSQVEGTKATFSDVLKAEASIYDTEMHSDVDEVINYVRAMNYGLERLASLPLSLRLIKEIHGVLLEGVRGLGKTPGEFRRTQNWIGGPTIQTASFVPPPADRIMELLDNLEKYFYDNSRLPVLIKSGLIHAQFEGIHPFLDGNGRTGRLLVTFYLCHKGVLRKPLLYLSSFIKGYRQDYYDKLQAFHVKDDIEGWLKFFLTGVAETAKQAIDTAQKIQKLREDNLLKIMKLGRSKEKALLLFNALFRTPMVRVIDIERITSLSNPNALLLTVKMQQIGVLKEITGKKRNRVYCYQQYIELFE